MTGHVKIVAPERPDPQGTAPHRTTTHPPGGRGKSGPSRDRPELELARHCQRQRARRGQIFGLDLFRDPAWEIMIDLFHAELLGRRVTVSDACLAAGVPQSTALRHANKLLSAGLIERTRDPTDKRRQWLQLTDEATAALGEWLRETWPEKD